MPTQQQQRLQQQQQQQSLAAIVWSRCCRWGRFASFDKTVGCTRERRAAWVLLLGRCPRRDLARPGQWRQQREPLPKPKPEQTIIINKAQLIGALPQTTIPTATATPSKTWSRTWTSSRPIRAAFGNQKPRQIVHFVVTN